jgi:hypothetical protein
MKKQLTLTFLAGIVAGAVLSPNWRSVAKKGIKAGIKGGRKLKELSQQAIDDLEDVAAEAAQEVDEQDRSRAHKPSVN